MFIYPYGTSRQDKEKGLRGPFSSSEHQRRSVDGPACHLDINDHRWYVVLDGDFEVIALIE